LAGEKCGKRELFVLCSDHEVNSAVEQGPKWNIILKGALYLSVVMLFFFYLGRLACLCDVLLEFRFSQGITVRGSGGSTQWAKNAEKIYPISGCYVVKLISGAVSKRPNAQDSRIERKNLLIFSTIEQCHHFRCFF
jgi:hypothetical protein